jgi:type I restriction enzyme M protein
LFVNADAEFREGRAQSYLDPEHVEKIVRAFEAFRDIDGFAAVVTRETLAENEDNLNIRRYADNAPPPEPHDVRAHLAGGVPKREVNEKSALLTAHGLEPAVLFAARPDGAYLDFAPALVDRAAIRRVIEADAGVTARESALRTAFDTWWHAYRPRIVELLQTRNVMALRAEALESFAAAVAPVGKTCTDAATSVPAS